MVGATVATARLNGAEAPPIAVTTRGCGPAVTSNGTWKLIWCGLTNNSGAATLATVMEVPSTDTGRVPIGGNPARLEAARLRLSPKMVAQPPGATLGRAGARKAPSGRNHPPGPSAP